MSSISASLTMMLASTALFVIPAATAFSSDIHTSSSSHTQSRSLNLPTLEAEDSLSAIEKLTAKRLSLKCRRRRAKPSSAVESSDISVDTVVGGGLEYFYDLKDARDSDDPFHIILLGS